ncbi:bacterial Ig-like domain-containing protein [Lactobacillus selangorensis]|uniref:Beta-fructosidase n=1 Tax=Lactobacillus selangorensis TaxID=81857 RepID=A0A0R2GAK9_9LACO|nr:bacterial Ig-like domain-containing protein [Lactobacillus selangorensis]KRN33773.1 beta-fructosidase [Lactobacillus selangorensis]
MSADSAATITAPVLSGFPVLSNFYVQPDGSYVLYNAKSSMWLGIYEGLGSGWQAYGIYVILPSSFTSTLADAQTAADSMLAEMQSSGEFDNATSVTAYQLADLKGRQVFYLRPNDGAVFNGAPGTSAAKISFKFNFTTAADTSSTPESVTMNANTLADISKDVLFAGTGNYTSGGFYTTVSTSSLGMTDAPDANIAGIVYSGINRILTYTHVAVYDTYTVVDKDKLDANGNPTVLKVIQTQTGQDGTTYSRDGHITLSGLGLSGTQYSQSSLSINEGTLTSTQTFTPSKWSVDNPGTAVLGTNYTITVGEVHTSLNAQSTTGSIAGPNQTWTPADNFVSATDINGKALSVDDVTVSYPDGKVDPTTPGTYTIVYSYTDPQGNAVSQTVTATFKQTAAAVNSNDATLIAGPDNTWNPEMNFVSATAADGTALTYNQITVEGAAQVNTTTPGKYAVVYSYTDKYGNTESSTATITVVASQAAVNVHDTTYVAGPNNTWTPADSFTSATDAKGNALDLSAMTISGAAQVDLTTAGTYPVTFSYTDSEGNTITKTADVNVVASKANIFGHSSTISNGSAWSPLDNIDGVVDMDGNTIASSAATSTNNVNVKVAGNYTVTYQYTDGAGNDITKSYTVTVSNSQSTIYAHNSNLPSGAAWTAADNFDGATDSNGDAVPFSDVTVSGTVDPATAGSYQITYGFTDVSGNAVSKTITVTVGDSQMNIYAHNSEVRIGSAWTGSDNFDGATDVDGNTVAYSQVQVDGSVDTSKAGKYNVTYTYTDANGESISKTIVVTVADSRSALYAHDSSLGIGAQWTAQNNFDGAVDANGNAVSFANVTTSGTVDTSKAGVYHVTYQFTDQSGTVIAKTVTVTIANAKTNIYAHNSEIANGSVWTPSDNFDGAVDENGNNVAYGAQIATTITDAKGNPQTAIDTTKAGTYNVTYSYTDATGETASKTIMVTVDPTADKGSIAGHDSTIVAGAAATWQAQDNLNAVYDENGNPVALDSSAITTSGTVDPHTPGNYQVTYTYTDGRGIQHTTTVNVTVVATQAAIYGHDSTISIGSSWSAANNFDGATNENGDAIDFADVKVTGTVDTSTAGTYQIQYSYTDEAGNAVTKTVTVTVADSHASVYAHNSEMPIGSTWNPEDNFDGATDIEGNPVDFSSIKVAGTVDTTKTGPYQVTYSYTDQAGNLISKTVAVTIGNSHSNIYAHNSQLGLGSTWTGSDNFDGAMDANGNTVDFSKVTVTGSVNTAKAGSYDIEYSFTDVTGVLVTKTVTVTIADSKTSIYAHNSEVANGSVWQPEDNFDGAVDENGNNVSYGILISTTIKDENDAALSTIDTTKAGTYQVTYSYTDISGETVSKTVQVIVAPAADQGSVTAHDSEIVAGPDATWSAYDNFTGATDENGNPIVFGSEKITTTGTVDPHTPGTYQVTYTYVDGRGMTHTSVATITVVASQANLYAHSSEIANGSTWNAENNFDGATDENGEPVDFSHVTVSGDTVNPNQSGSYHVIYTYTDQAGNTVTKSVTVTVSDSQTNIYAHNSELPVNAAWSAADNFDGATDANGNPVSFGQLSSVEGTVNTKVPGAYQITYTYTDTTGKTVAKMITVTVSDSVAQLYAHDSEVAIGSTWNAADNFDGAVDANGKTVADSAITVSGDTVDTSKPGAYHVTYTFTDASGETIAKTVTVTVADSKAAIYAHNSQIANGATWNPADNFDGAVDANGNAMNFSAVTVTGTVDSSTARRLSNYLSLCGCNWQDNCQNSDGHSWGQA